VRPGETGVLVPDGDEPALARAIVGLLRDDAMRARMGAAGQRIFHDEFTATSMVGRYEALYREGARALPALRGASV
jgi:glycosyltransferase involved in cell wall biosynthesis